MLLYMCLIILISEAYAGVCGYWWFELVHISSDMFSWMLNNRAEKKNMCRHFWRPEMKVHFPENISLSSVGSKRYQCGIILNQMLIQAFLAAYLGCNISVWVFLWPCLLSEVCFVLFCFVCFSFCYFLGHSCGIWRFPG